MKKKVDADPVRELAREVAKTCHDKKGKEIVVLDLRKLSGFTDYFVIASGNSDRQVRAISDQVGEQLAKRGTHPIGVEGYEKGDWVLIDFGSVVAHLFRKEVREHYALETFWKKAKRVRFSLK